MPNVLRWVVFTVGLVVLAPMAGAEEAPPPPPPPPKMSIFVTEATGPGGVPLDKSLNRYLEVADYVSREFRCARVENSSRIRALISHEKERQLLTCEEDESVLGLIGKEMGADRLVRTTITQDGNYLSYNIEMYDFRRGRVAATATGVYEMKGGQKPADVDKFLQGLMDQLADQTAICRLVGTITVTSETKQDTTTTTPREDFLVHEQPASAVTTDTTTQNAKQVWSFDVTGDATKLDSKVTVSGGGSSSFLSRKISTGVDCHENGKDLFPANVTDDNALEDHWTIIGPSDVPGTEPKIELRFNAEARTYSLSINATASTTHKGKHVESRYGTCGRVDKPEPGADAERKLPLPLMFSSGTLNGRRSDPTLSHTSFETSEDGFTRTKVEWALRWDKAPKPLKQEMTEEERQDFRRKQQEYKREQEAFKKRQDAAKKK